MFAQVTAKNAGMSLRHSIQCIKNNTLDVSS